MNEATTTATTFLDSKNRKWGPIAIDFSTVKRVRADTSVELIKPDAIPALLDILHRDPVQAVEVLASVLAGPISAASISRDEFINSINMETLSAAVDLLVEAIAVFHGRTNNSAIADVLRTLHKLGRSNLEAGALEVISRTATASLDLASKATSALSRIWATVAAKVDGVSSIHKTIADAESAAIAHMAAIVSTANAAAGNVNPTS